MPKKYIELEAAIIGLAASSLTPHQIDDAAEALQLVPAADVVEVVRCRECKHYNAGFECLIEGYGIERPADYFCADGERKDGGQDNGI